MTATHAMSRVYTAATYAQTELPSRSRPTMSDQTEQDFREIERERDLPPDEPYPRDEDDPLAFDEGAECENAARELGEDGS
jgi:hypothetical protein